MTNQIRFTYLNRKGLRETREIIPDAVEFLFVPGFGYQPGWFISGFCLDRKARRSFALSRIEFTEDSGPRPFTLARFKP